MEIDQIIDITEQWIKEGYQAGLKAGKESGFENGFFSGWEEGVNIGYQLGKELLFTRQLLASLSLEDEQEYGKILKIQQLILSHSRDNNEDEKKVLLFSKIQAHLKQLKY